MRLTNEFAIENTKLLSFIVDSLEGPCYIADMETHELLYINKHALEILGCENSAVQGQKCYKMLQNKSEPCAFCTNKYLKENEYYRWEHYNAYLNRYYEIKDTLILHEGKKLRLEIATDITAAKEKYFEMERKTAIEELLVQCASTLCKDTNIDCAINEILAMLGGFYKANRAYLFKIDEFDQYAINSHEWCAEGIETQIHKLQKVPVSIISEVINHLTKKGSFAIDSLDQALDINSDDYKVFKALEIKGLIMVSLVDKGKIVGFLGVDDPTVNTKNIQILETVAMFILDDLMKINVANQLEFLSSRDCLTGIYNRNHYDIMLKKFRESLLESIGIIYIDINGVKIINEKYGYGFGDRYIVSCTQILKEHFDDHIFRIGGDEFVILLTNMEYSVFNKKVQDFEEKLKNNKRVSISIGASWCSDIGEIEKHIKSADATMLKNKETHYKSIDECIQFFQFSSEEALIEEIKQNRFEILLQPKIFLDNGKIAGAEALVRKKDEFGNYVFPYLFIPRYEEQGIIYFIDLFVLRQVCEFLAEARENKITNIPQISINYSRVTLLTVDIHSKTKLICNEYDIDPSMITIEVTEDCGFVESKAIEHSIEKFKEMGFKIALDDFGCKYSNIEIVSTISFDEVKLDKSLLNNNNVSKQIILEHLIEMFQAFPDIAIVVEGIEEKEHLDLFKSNKGLIGQGYLFSKPISKEKFWKYLSVENEGVILT